MSVVIKRLNDFISQQQISDEAKKAALLLIAKLDKDFTKLNFRMEKTPEG